MADGLDEASGATKNADKTVVTEPIHTENKKCSVVTTCDPVNSTDIF